MAQGRAVQKRPPAGVKRFSLLPRGLREKLIVAFGLMSVVPLLVMGYVLANYVFPHLKSIGDISLVVGLAVFISLLGFWVARGIVMPVIKLASQAEVIAQGNLEKMVDVEAPDEVGSLGVALNQITQRVRDNMSQLRVYGEQTKHLNLEINRRILTFSHLLQVSNLISQSAKIEEVVSFILEKLAQLDETELNCVLERSGNNGEFVIRSAIGSDTAQARALQGTKVQAPWLGRALEERRLVVVHGDSAAASPEGQALQQMFGMTNAVCQPLLSIGQGIGVLVSANKKPGFTFEEDCLDLLKVFGKQMTIAVENDLLTKRAEELKVIDELTGLYNAGYMNSRVDEEIRRAVKYHRPCSLVLLKLDGFQQIQDLYGALAGEDILHQTADLLKEQLTEVDRVGRMAQDEFAIILPELNKREAMEVAEKIRAQVASTKFTSGQHRLDKPVTVSAGVSENPIDGATGQALLAKAAAAVQKAKQEGKNRVVAA